MVSRFHVVGRPLGEAKPASVLRASASRRSRLHHTPRVGEEGGLGRRLCRPHRTSATAATTP